MLPHANIREKSFFIYLLSTFPLRCFCCDMLHHTRIKRVRWVIIFIRLIKINSIYANCSDYNCHKSKWCAIVSRLVIIEVHIKYGLCSWYRTHLNWFALRLTFATILKKNHWINPLSSTWTRILPIAIRFQKVQIHVAQASLIIVTQLLPQFGQALSNYDPGLFVQD